MKIIKESIMDENTKKGNFTFRKNIPIGKYGSFEPEFHEIKLNRKVVGGIYEIRNMFYRKDKENLGKFEIRFAVNTEKTKELPTYFEWVTFKKKFDNAEEARNFVRENKDRILANLDLYLFED